MRCQSIALAAIAATSAMALPFNVDLNYSDLELIVQEAPQLAAKIKSQVQSVAGVSNDSPATVDGSAVATPAATSAPAPAVYGGARVTATSTVTKLLAQGYGTPAATPAATPAPDAGSTPAPSLAPAATPSSAPAAPPAPAGGAGKGVVAYWGQGAGDSDMSPYCASDSGIDTLVLSFVTTWGTGTSIKGAFGVECAFTEASATNCDKVASAVETCKKNGKRVLVSLGGQTGEYSLASKSAAEQTATQLFGMFGAKGPASSASRPLGDSFADGFDMDVEKTAANTYLGDLMTGLRSEFAKDTANKYIITGAPQCPWPEINMGDSLTSAAYDELYIQFYNNPSCSASQFPTVASAQGQNGFNFDAWKGNLASTPSKDAKLFIGLPAAPAAAGQGSFIPVSKMADLVNKFKDDASFGGVMMWDAKNSDSQKDGGCTFAQNVQSVLTKGKLC